MNKIIKRIDEAKHIVVISHVNPDADSIGSASAFYTYLLTLHKKVSFFCVTKDINNKLSFLPWFDKIRNTFASSADLAIALDCGDVSRLGVDLDIDLINIDHHQSNNNYAKYNLVNKKAISTTQILYNFFKENSIKINKKMATALYAGLLDDSNGFMDERVDGTFFATIKELIDSGADIKLCNRYIMQYMSLSALRLKGLMLRNMQLCNNAQVAIFIVKNEDMLATGAIGEDCEYALEESLSLPSVKVALLLKENSNSTIKGSLRSVSGVDVLKIASLFNGGGHTNRAGFNLSDENSIDEIKEKILELIRN